MPDKYNNNHKNYNNKGLSNRLKKEDSDKTKDKDKDKPIAKLLIVDDDPDTSHVLKISLLKNGFSVNTFTSPERHYKNFTLVQRIIP